MSTMKTTGEVNEITNAPSNCKQLAGNHSTKSTRTLPSSISSPVNPAMLSNNNCILGNIEEDGSSPTSIVTVSLASSPSPPLHDKSNNSSNQREVMMRSVIAVREDGGAEVTLATPSATSTNCRQTTTPPHSALVGAQTPQQQHNQLQRKQHHCHNTPSLITPRNDSNIDNTVLLRHTMNALLDSEITPSPLKQQQNHSIEDNSKNYPNGSKKCSPGEKIDDIVWDITNTPDDASPQCCLGITVGGTECGIPAPQLSSLSTCEVQEKISNLLGSPIMVETFLQSWQAWSYNFMEPPPPPPPPSPNNGLSRGVLNSHSPSSQSVEELKSNIRRSLKNRAMDMHARKARLNALRRDLSPFNATPPGPISIVNGNNNVSPEGHGFRPRSFSTVISENARTRYKPCISGKENISPLHANGNSPVYQIATPEQDVTSSLWQCGMQCVLQDLPNIDDDDEDENDDNNANRNIHTRSFRRVDSLDDDCYDSDPEVFAICRRSTNPAATALAMVMGKGNQSLNPSSCSNNICSPQNTPSQRAPTDNKENARPPSTRRKGRKAQVVTPTSYKFRNQNTPRNSRRRGRNGMSDNNSNTDFEVKMTVQEIMNERMTLVLHQNSQNSQNKALRPRGVHAWVERGQNLKNTVLPPRIVWSAIHPPTSATTKMASTIRRRMFFQREETNSIALLDIHRILEVEKIDRMAHPFVKTQNTFLIKTLDRTVMFEASSTSERDRIIKSLKMLVARLGSMLLLRDDALVDEFFAGGDMEKSLGPGEKPYWLESNDETV